MKDRSNGRNVLFSGNSKGWAGRRKERLVVRNSIYQHHVGPPGDNQDGRLARAHDNDTKLAAISRSQNVEFPDPPIRGAKKRNVLRPHNGS